MCDQLFRLKNGMQSSKKTSRADPVFSFWYYSQYFMHYVFFLRLKCTAGVTVGQCLGPASGSKRLMVGLHLRKMCLFCSCLAESVPVSEGFFKLISDAELTIVVCVYMF